MAGGQPGGGLLAGGVMMVSGMFSGRQIRSRTSCS
jgi:hypothetical protein